ncbi:MAG: hypothetical protein KAR38_14590, partial [Calditrichia bacterium]|nr:hypothetical protein [Calditrichia bacterium]
FILQESDNNFVLEIGQNGKTVIIIPVDFPLEGMAYNMTAAYIAARHANIANDELIKGFSGFNGVKRRLEKIYDDKGYIVYDDFAHHPTAVNITLNAVKKKYPKRPIIAIFEPRSNTSIRNIFLNEYKEALLPADYIFIAPAFKKASVNKEDLLNVKEISEYLVSKGKRAKTAEQHDKLLEKCIASLPENPVIVLMSNGSFEPFKTSLIDFLKSNS